MPEVGQVRLARPVAAAETGEVGGAEGGGFDSLGADDRDAEHVGLNLHEEIVAGRAAVDAEGGWDQTGIGGHGVDDIAGLVGDRFEGGASNIFAVQDSLARAVVSAVSIRIVP